MKIPPPRMFQTFNEVLRHIGLSEAKAALCARIFTENSRDRVYSHGLNRFPVFVQAVRENQVDIYAEPSEK